MSSFMESPRKWRTSLLFSGFGVNWPSKGAAANNNSSSTCRTAATTMNAADDECVIPKRHNSVSFAISPPPPSTTTSESSKERKQPRLRGSYSQSLRTGTTASHHGSVQNLVFRQKICAAVGAMGNNGKRSSNVGPIPRRPSTPSLAFTIVRTMSGRRRQDSCTFSLDEEEVAEEGNDDSAYGSASSSSACSSCSFCSSCSKRASGLSVFSSGGGTAADLLQTPPCNRCIGHHLAAGKQHAAEFKWTEKQRAEIESELDQICAQSLGHLFVKCSQLAFATNSIHATTAEVGGQNSQSAMNSNSGSSRADDVLCADGKVQFHLLSMVAPAGKRVVNVGSVPTATTTASCNSPSLRYNANSLRLAMMGGGDAAAHG